MKTISKIFWIALIAKMILAAVIPLTSDESYYWVWSYHPQLSYFDHPALISLLYWLGQPFENFGSAVRWPGVLLSHASLFLWLYFFQKNKLLSEKQSQVWLVLALLHPLFGLGSLIVTPDLPLLFFWPLSLILFFDLLAKPSQMRALGFGVALGLGLLSKYMIVLLPLSLLLGLVFDLKSFRKLFKYIPIAILGTICAALPLLIWNYENDWASFGFQLKHGITSKPWKPSWTYEYVLAQALILFPPLIYLAAKNFFSVNRWLRWVTLVPLFFFLLTSFRGYVEVNWPIMIYPTFLAMVAQSSNLRLLNFVKIFWSVALVGLVFLITTQYSPFSKPIKTKEFYEFEDLYSVAKEHDPLFADSYQMASRLSFETGRMIYKMKGLNRFDNFDMWSGSAPPRRFFLLIRKDDELPGRNLLRDYEVLMKKEVSPKFDLLEMQKE